jgi:hypothetical protein
MGELPRENESRMLFLGSPPRKNWYVPPRLNHKVSPPTVLKVKLCRSNLLVTPRSVPDQGSLYTPSTVSDTRRHSLGRNGCGVGLFVK